MKLTELVGKTIDKVDRFDSDRVRITLSDGIVLLLGPDGLTTDHTDRDGDHSDYVFVDV